MRRGVAFVSCDVDPVDTHLAGYGVRPRSPCPLAATVAVPRLLALAAELGIRMTWFWVARDARTQAEVLRQAVAQGHEIAAHAWSHPVPFAREATRLRHEVAAPRRALQAATGQPVWGFRAPGWDAPAAVRRAIADAGYRYDASAFPSPMLVANRIAVARRGGRWRTLLAASWPTGSWSRRPRRRGGLVEIPIATTPWLRLPCYHTLAHVLPDRIFDRILDACLRDEAPVGYVIHAVDALALDDGVDPRLARHPGMDRPLEAKLRRLRAVLGRIAAHRDVVPMAHCVRAHDATRPGPP